MIEYDDTDRADLHALFLQYDAIYKTTQSNLFEVVQNDQFGLYCIEKKGLLIPLEYYRIYVLQGPYALVSTKYQIINGHREQFGLYSLNGDGLVLPPQYVTIQQLSIDIFVVSEAYNKRGFYDASTRIMNWK
jgi:hypothetical protein